MAINISFEYDRCKGCELCTIVCPKKLVAINNEITNAGGYHPADVKDKEACVGCASCAKMCPDSVISIERI